MKQIYNLLVFTFIITFAFKSYGQEGAEGAIYNLHSESDLTYLTGTLGGVPFTISNINDVSLDDENFSLSDDSGEPLDYSGAPLSETQQSVTYDYDSNWSITFETPIENLRLYCKYWRTFDGYFNHSFTILSGSKIQKLDNNGLRTESFANAIIEFSGPITTLTLNTEGGSTSSQVMTFGIKTTPLSTSDVEIATNKVEIYPNPSSKFIQVLGLTKSEKYKIYNSIGTEIKRGYTSNNETIDIRNFRTGMYFLKFENGNAIKFIKE
jgi:hypothetical protein